MGKPKGRVRYATAAEERALRAAEKAADAGAAWRREQREAFERARQADRDAGIPWWRRV